MSKQGFHQSSLTKKYIVALAGLFLIVFLFVHLGINLLILIGETSTYQERELFNIAAHFMGTNWIIKVFEVVLFGGFLIHILWAIIVQIQNWLARPKRYKKEGFSHTSPFSKYMIHTGAIILVFLVIHLIDFYFSAKFFGAVEEISYDGGLTHVHDLGALVIAKFQDPWYILFYIVAFILLAFHLHHAFQSGFQSLGWNHPTYFPTVKNISAIIAIFLAIGYTVIPLIIYFN